jgi:hypothetical protein
VKLLLEGVERLAATDRQHTDLQQMGNKGAAESGAAGSRTGSHEVATDLGLQQVMKAWPALPVHIREAILVFIS